MLLLSAVNVLQQWTWAAACSWGSTATSAQLLVKISVIFVILFSYFLFREERAIITSPAYILGTMFSLIGVAGILEDNPASLLPRMDLATVLLLITAVLWAVYTVWSKHLVTNVHPVPMFAVVAAYSTILLGGLSVAIGEPAALVTAGWKVTGIAIFSGILPIAVAHTCFNHAQKRLGSSFSSSIILLNPLLTYLIAMMLWPDEKLSVLQWCGAGALLLGTMLVTWAGPVRKA
jgi:drug/metabolite transporter (DMT)-like permease